MFKLTASTLLALALPLLGGTAVAGPKCQAQKEQWMKESDFKAKVEAEGYRITTFKVSKGQCYEIYGHDKAGKKVEIYFDPVTAAVLESK